MTAQRGIVIVMCTDISSYAQHSACGRFIFWLLVPTSYIVRHQANYTKTRMYTETKYHYLGQLHIIRLKYIKNMPIMCKSRINSRWSSDIIKELYDNLLFNVLSPHRQHKEPSMVRIKSLGKERVIYTVLWKEGLSLKNNLDANGIFKNVGTTFSIVQKSESVLAGEDKPDSLAE